MEIIQVKTSSELEQVKELFREYYRFLARNYDLDISYQGVEDEIAELPGKFGPPKGRLILAVKSGHSAGCAALRPLDNDICELKRMYVLPDYQGQGIGKALAQMLIHEAKEIGYHQMRLDTGSFLTAAISLYESLGFRQIEPYNDVPENIRQVAIFMELTLV